MRISKRIGTAALICCIVCLLSVTACAVPENSAAVAATQQEEQDTAMRAPASAPEDTEAADAAAFCTQQGLLSAAEESGLDLSNPMPRKTLLRTMRGVFMEQPLKTAPSFIGSIIWAVKNGIIRDQGIGIINDAPSTLEQAVDMLWRGAGDSGDAASGTSDWAADAMEWAASRGILSGLTEDGTPDPKEHITVEQTALLICNYLMPGTEGNPGTTEKGTLVAYFSATGTTAQIAGYAADILEAQTYEIVPAEPYTEADLAYYTDGRADQEQRNPDVRPAIAGSIPDMQNYDVILLGYPIWHGQAPRIINTFLESGDFSGITIVPFCTSHSSPVGSSAVDLHALAPGADWREGRRFAAGTTRAEVADWLRSLGLPVEGSSKRPVFDMDTKKVMLNSGYEMPVNGIGTYSLHGDTCVDSVKTALASGVRLIDTARAYGNEEEVGRAVREAMQELGIPREEIFVTTKIYPGSDMADPETAIQECIDRLDIGYVDLMLLHHPDPNDVKAYKAMEKFVSEGKIHSIGLSNWYVKELDEFLPQVSTPPALVQNEIHPYYQENDVIPYIQEHGIVVQGWYPLGGRGHTAELLADPVISEIAASHGVSSAQVILRWNLQKGVSVIPGSSNPDHIRENTQLFGFELTEEEMDRINALDRNEKHDWY